MNDERQQAQGRVREMRELLQSNGKGSAELLTEVEGLERAIAAFHIEGIRFRMFNVDRLAGRERASLPAEIPSLLEQIRRHLEAAGFHTRSHQAPG